MLRNNSNRSALRRRGPLRALAVTAALGLLVVACGGDDVPDEAEAAEEQSDDTEADETEVEEAEVDEGDAFYEGRTLNIVVPFSAGGGTDTVARFLAAYYGDFIEGEPEVQVENVTGGGGVIGTNEFALQRPADGEHALFSAGSTSFTWLLREPAAEFDLRAMQPVIGVPTGAILWGTPETGISESMDVFTTEEELIFGAVSATGRDAIFLVAFEVLGLDVNTIVGYDGRGDARLATESGELNIDWQSTGAYQTHVQPLVDEGAAVPIFSGGQIENGELVRDPQFPDVPTVKELYVEMYGEEPSGAAWEAYRTMVAPAFTLEKMLWLREDAPQEAVDALIAAGEAFAADPDFNEARGEALGDYDLVVGEGVRAAVDDMLDVDDQVLDWLIDFLVENYDLDPR